MFEFYDSSSPSFCPFCFLCPVFLVFPVFLSHAFLPFFLSFVYLSFWFLFYLFTIPLSSLFPRLFLFSPNSRLVVSLLALFDDSHFPSFCVFCCPVSSFSCMHAVLVPVTWLFCRFLCGSSCWKFFFCAFSFLCVVSPFTHRSYLCLICTF